MPLIARRAPVEATERPLGRRAGRKYGGGPSWLVTFVDLVSLMLAFFVMRFAMTTLDSPRYEEAAASITMTLGRVVSPVEQAPPEPLSVETETNGRGLRPGYLERLMESKLSADPLLSKAVLVRSGDRLVIALPSDLLFASASAQLVPAARQAIREMATALSYLPNRIEVVGHADPLPFEPGGRYGSNWELSMARADAVARALVGSGFPRMPLVEGQGDSRFPNLAPTLPMEQRFRLARRVDLVILPERAP